MIAAVKRFLTALFPRTAPRRFMDAWLDDVLTPNEVPWETTEERRRRILLQFARPYASPAHAIEIDAELAELLRPKWERGER
jgi:hypothetical protein